jgi:undecaprenyl diphosphate synthase
MANISKDNFPKNIGIIMDGNGRWALKNSFKISEGHKKGVKVVRKIVEESVKLNIQSLNLYAFSSENWQRPKAEINAIKKLVIDAINEQVPELKEQKVQLKFFGHTEDFGERIINKIQYAESETLSKNKKMDLNVALSYGGQQDILDIVRGVSKHISEGKMKLEDIDQSIINQYSCAPVDSLDLLIRTGGDKRVSNFMLYQIAYAEIMFIDKYWPDFSSDDYKKCLNKFKKASRRFGKRI